MIKNIGIIGAGSWGTALAILLANNGHCVTLWSYNPQEVKELDKKRIHEKKLPGIKIPNSITLTSNLKAATIYKDVVIMAVPSTKTRDTARKMSGMLTNEQIVVNVSKGIEETTLMTLSEQIQQEIPHVQIAVLSGPSHAEEVARGLPTTCVVGCQDKDVASLLQNIFMSDVFRVYTSTDVKGIEIGGALKNVVALAAGIADGLGYGDNTKAALITRGIAEISRLGMKMDCRSESFSGLTGIGDLIVTCASVHSRNRKAGFLIGQGQTMVEAMDEVKMVVEGVYSAKAALALSKKYDVSMPIVEQVNEVLFNNKKAQDAVEELMMRDPRAEHSVFASDKYNVLPIGSIVTLKHSDQQFLICGLIPRLDEIRADYCATTYPNVYLNGSLPIRTFDREDIESVIFTGYDNFDKTSKALYSQLMNIKKNI